MIRRRLREKLFDEKEAAQIQDQFASDWLFSLTSIELNVGVLGFIRDILKGASLTSADAVHLASTVWVQDALKLGKKFGSAGSREILFACYDVRLGKVAESFGFMVFKP